MSEIPAHPEKRTDFRTRLILAGLVVLSSFLSFFFFQKQSLRLDESQSLWQTSHSPGGILHLIGQDVHVPLYHMLLHAWQFFLGNDVAIARILSLIFFLLSIPAIYMLGHYAYNRRIGVFTAILFAVSPFMNWYGNEIRMYSMFVFIGILNQYFFLKIFKSDESGAWIGFAITAFFGMYTHYFFFLMLFTDAVFYFFNRRLFAEGSMKRFLKIAGGLAILFLPWIGYVLYLGGISNSSPNLAPPNTVSIFNTFSQFVFGFQTDHLNTILVSLWPLTVLLGFLALRNNRKVTPETFYFILGFLLPNAVAFVVSFVISPVYLTRYLIFTLPMMYLLLAWLFSTYPKPIGSIARIILVGAMAITLVIEASSAATPAKENYREAVEYIEAHADPGDVIVVSAPFTIYPVLYYYKGPLTVTTLPIWNQDLSGAIPAYSEADLPKQIDTIKGDHKDLWLLQSYDQGYQESMHQYFDSHFQRLDMKVFSPGMTLYEYKLRYDQ